jgi:heparan-alpha-glucosaminide N-acetyltransferase
MQAPAARNTAVDAYRGFVMVLMMAEVLQLSRLAEAFPSSALLSFFAYHQTHVDWAGCSLHDLIQPSFSFLVGVALPYSVARRKAEGGRLGRLFVHAVWRAFVLIGLGIFLRSTHSSQTNFTFEDTLTQIGLGYPFLFLLAFRSARAQWIAFAGILAACWLAWLLYPVPGGGYDFQAVGVPPDWPHHYNGLAAHWNKNANLGHAFDVWFLNLFPRPERFVANHGGYLTLSFIPTLATMILGLVAGQWLRASAPALPLRRLAIAGVAGLALGGALHVLGINPVVKRIWTPAWTLFSGGWCFLLLAAFCWVIEGRGYRRWAFPLIVVGLNSIAAYVIAHLWEPFIVESFRIHFGHGVFAMLGEGVTPLVRGAVVLAVYWLTLYWMYRRKIFLRI